MAAVRRARAPDATKAKAKAKDKPKNLAPLSPLKLLKLHPRFLSHTLWRVTELATVCGYLARRACCADDSVMDDTERALLPSGVSCIHDGCIRGIWQQCVWRKFRA